MSQDQDPAEAAAEEYYRRLRHPESPDLADIIRRHYASLRAEAEKLADAVESWDGEIEKVIGRPADHPMATESLRTELARHKEPENA